jgi:hypothetical protein
LRLQINAIGITRLVHGSGGMRIKIDDPSSKQGNRAVAFHRMDEERKPGAAF